jgi:hypothetical protein
VFVLLVSSRPQAASHVSLKANPLVAFAPAEVTVRAMVDTHPDNRRLEIVAEAPSFYRSSEIPLEGEFAPRTSFFHFLGLPVGEYTVRATVRDQRGHVRARTEITLKILGDGA